MKRANKHIPYKSNKLKTLGEFGLIKNIQSQWGKLPSDVLIGIGDDAAALRPHKNTTLITSDMMIEGVHFDLSFTTFYQLGYKFLAVNISDILAMGGIPRHFVISMGVPPSLTAATIKDLYSGIMKIAKKFSISLIGGDTCRSDSGLILSGTLTGTAGKIITRSGAETGDRIYVTNTLGDSAMGLNLLKKRRRRIHSFSRTSPSMKLMRKHLMPEPAPLKATAKPSSMIDISDGLLIDLSHICDKSSVGAVIYKEKLPLSKELVAAAKKFAVDPADIALKGGEDYTLLFTSPLDINKGAYKIGEIIKKGRYIIDSKGRKRNFKPEGYEHFK